MSDTHGPIWIVEEPAQPYPDRRFDGVTPPLDPQQIADDARKALDHLRELEMSIADAARLAADDIALVFRLWPYSNAEALPNLRALHLLLIPPAPKWETMIEDMDAARQFVAEWQAQEPDSEDEKDQSAEDVQRPIGLFNYRSYHQ